MYPHLPANFTIRPPQEKDAQAIGKLIYAMESTLVEEPDRFTAEDIKHEWETLDTRTDVWCIFSPDTQLAAYGTLSSHDVTRYGHFLGDGYVHPDYQSLGLGSTLLDLMEARSAEISASQPKDIRLVLENNIVASSSTARALMKTYHYTLTRVFLLMRITFEQAPPLPVWPAGISLHVCTGSPAEQHLAHETIEEGFKDHFAHTPRTFEEWQRHMMSEHFDPSLWFLAMAGEQVVGAALCRIRDMDNPTGWLGQLAVLRPWRALGIGNALLQQTFHAFYQRGIKLVGLGVDSDSLTGAQRLYERAGMHVSMQIGRYEKELQMGKDLHPGRRI